MKQEEAKNAIKQAAKAVVESKLPERQVLAGTIHSQQSIFRGPIPPPEILKEYGLVVKDGGERIFAMAEREQVHTHKMDLLAMRAIISGQVLGFLIIAVAAGGGIWLVAHDKPISGFFSFFSGVAILLGGGYVGRKRAGRRLDNPEDKKNPSK